MGPRPRPHVVFVAAAALLQAAATGAAAGYREAVLADGPFAYWRLDESAGTEARDSSGNMNDGLYENSPGRGVAGATVDGNTAVSFDGADDVVRVPVSGRPIATFGAQMEDFTVEAWYRSRGTGSIRILLGTHNASSSDRVYFAVEREATQFVLKFRDTGGGTPMSVRMSAESSTRMHDGTYHHAVWVVENAAAGQARVYLDGEEDSGVTIANAENADGVFAPFDRDLAIGAVNSQGTMGQHIDATLDEVALYTGPLAPDRVREHYLQGIADGYALEVMRDDPFAYWRLDEKPPGGLRLLLDSRNVASHSNAVLRVGTVTKHTANPLFGEALAWEDRFDNVYPNVIYDEEAGLYKVWHFVRTANPRSDALGYATSPDGIAWTKPLMDIVIWEGQPSSLVAQHVHGAGVIKDALDPDPARRFKMFFKGQVMSVRFSPDGLNWGEFVSCSEIEAAGDTHNNALWVPVLGKYVGFTRHWTDSRRIVARTESTDFVRWSKSVEVLRGESLHDTYAMPVFRYAGLYLGLPSIYDEQADRVHVELAWSPDTLNWHRVDQGNALIPNAATPGAYDWGTAYASRPIFLEDEIRLFYGGGDLGHFDPDRSDSLCLATLRPAGFAGYEPVSPGLPAQVTTVPLALGASLRLTADAAGGSVVVTVLDEAGTELLTGLPVTGDVTDATVVWSGGTGPETLDGTPVRLRFTIDSAKLYAFTL